MALNPQDKCSVDYSQPLEKCPVDHEKSSRPSEACPVDHSPREKWSNLFGTNATASSSAAPPTLPTERDVSSIPRNDSENWVYPSQAQFFAAMARKKHNPRESDMKVIVPIHNAVNERAWGELMKWEEGQGGEGCGGVKLVSFKGRPGDKTPRARWNMLLGYVFMLSSSAAGRLSSVSFIEGTKHPLTDTTGLWTAVGHGYAMLLTFTQVEVLLEARTRHSSWTCARRWITGRAFECAWAAAGIVGSVGCSRRKLVVGQLHRPREVRPALRLAVVRETGCHILHSFPRVFSRARRQL